MSVIRIFLAITLAAIATEISVFVVPLGEQSIFILLIATALLASSAFVLRVRALKKAKVATVITLCLCFGFLSTIASVVWAPDVIFSRRVVLADAQSSGGGFRVTQFWNFGDFYTVELTHRDQGGQVWRVVLDGDAAKWWGCKLDIDEDTEEVSIGSSSWGERSHGVYAWGARRLIRRNGAILDAWSAESPDIKSLASLTFVANSDKVLP